MLLGIGPAGIVEQGSINESVDGWTPGSEAFLPCSENLGGDILADHVESPEGLAFKRRKFGMKIPGRIELDFLGHEGTEVKVAGDGEVLAVLQGDDVGVPKV